MLKPVRRFCSWFEWHCGRALLSLARIQGAQVFGTASPSKHDELRSLGTVPFDYSNKKWVMTMQELGGVNAVFDPLGYESFDESYSVLKKGGILVAYGMNLPALTNTRRRPAFPVILKLLSRNLIFWSGKRTTFFGLRRSSKKFIPDLELLFSWLKSGKISVSIKATFRLEEIQKAHREYASSAGMGSIVIEIRP